MRFHQIPTYYALMTGALSLAIYAMQLLGKVSTLAALVAGVLTVIKVLLDLRAASSAPYCPPASLSGVMACPPTQPSFALAAPARLHHIPRCACPSCQSFDHDVTMPLSPLRLGHFAVSTVDTETSEPWRYTAQRGQAGAYLLKTPETPQATFAVPLGGRSLARLLS